MSAAEPADLYAKPWRKVVSASPMPGWWNRLGARCDWYVVTECGHSLIRNVDQAPKRVRCEACDPVEEPESQP